MSETIFDSGPRAKLALLGVGYMGGSLALAARCRGLAGEVVGYDVSEAALATARERGVVDSAASTPESAVEGAGLVVLAAPVRRLPELVRRIGGAVGEAALVIDLGSVKAPIVRAVEAMGVVSRFVACHPLAGTEASGVAAADAELFVGKPCFICPSARTPAAARAAAARLWEGIGSSVLEIDADVHDAFMAAASHLPHVAAFALAASLAGASDILVARTPRSCPPTSLRDTTRVAASNPSVWTDIFLDNRTHLLPLVAELERRLGELRVALERDDAGALERLLAGAQATRRKVVDEL